MEGFDLLTFEWLLAERLVDRNIDPRGVTNVEIIHELEFMRWIIRVVYEIQLPGGPQQWMADRIVTELDLQNIDNMETWMEDEARRVANQFQGILIPNRHEWFEHLTNLMERMRENRNGI